MPTKKKLQQIPDQELIELIREDPNYLSVVYKNTRENCQKFMYKMSKGSKVKEEEIQGIFHNAVIILYEKIIKEDFQLTNNSSIGTYLTSICKFQLLDQFKKLGWRANIEEGENWIKDFQTDPSIEDELREIEIQDEEQFKALEKGLNKLKKAGGNCYEILVFFWYHSKSIREITEHFGYTNDVNTRNQKSRCQKRLQKMVQDELKGE